MINRPQIGLFFYGKLLSEEEKKVKIRVILWDIDGTILNFIEAEKAAIKMCFAQFQLGECSDEMIARYSVINKSYWERLELGEISKQEVLEGRFLEFFRQEGISLEGEIRSNGKELPEDDLVRRFNMEYQKRLGDTICFHDDAYELIQRLKGRVKQYAVTNGTRMAQERKLERSGLGQLFDGVFISEDVGIEKPNKEFFDHVFQQIGDYEKDEIMIVGDSLSSDMKGGNNAGIICCWYHPQEAGKESSGLGPSSLKSLSLESLSQGSSGQEPLSRKNSATQPQRLRIDYEIQNLWQVEEII